MDTDTAGDETLQLRCMSQQFPRASPWGFRIPEEKCSSEPCLAETGTELGYRKEHSLGREKVILRADLQPEELNPIDPALPKITLKSF